MAKDKKEDPEFLLAIEFTNLIMSGFKQDDPVSLLPWLRYFIPFPHLKRLKEGVSLRDPFLREQFVCHIKDFDPNNLKDFTDSLLSLTQDERKSKNIGTELTIDVLEMIVADLFVAGHETTVTSSCYLLH